MAMLDGQIALVTGAAGDLGNEMALHLAHEGASVVMWDVKSETEALDRINRVRTAGTVLYQQVDVRDRSAVDAAINNSERLDIVCSNAGIVESSPFLEVSQEN